jgi:hypothetical protein
MGSLTKDLRKGDRVVISRSSRYYNTSSSNPPDSVKGTVRYDRSGSVEWDNGTTNGYGDNDLVKITESVFKEGDRVFIAKTSEFYNTSNSTGDVNPPDTLGTISEVIGTSGYYLQVKWDNGMTNTYREIDLVFNTSSSRPTSTGLTKTPVIGKWYTNPAWSTGSMSKFRTITHGTEFGYSERMYPGDTVTQRLDSSWTLYEGVRLATESELRILPKSHPDHPDYKEEKKSEYKPKTGDRVKIIANRSGSSNQIGDIGIVGYDHGTNCTVDVDGRSKGGNCHYYDDLEFISYKSSFNFKEGDKVKIIANTNRHSFTIGATGILKGSKGVASKGGYYWSVDGIEKKVSSNSVRECDMELVTSTTSVEFAEGDVVKIIGNSNYSSNKVGDIGVIYKKNSSDSFEVRVPGGPTSSISTRVRDMEKVDPSLLSKPSISSSKVWRVKTQKEMYDEGIIKSPKDIPYGWSAEMIKYFGTTIDPKHYSEIERVTNGSAYQWCGAWWVKKNEITTKTLPWGSTTMTSSDSSDDDDEDDDEQEEESSSWEYKVSEGVYDSDLDKLDAMSAGYKAHMEGLKIVYPDTYIADWPDMGSSPKRPKQEVEMIPHKSRRIF